MIVTPEALRAIYFAFSRLFQSYLGEVSNEYSIFTSTTDVETPEGYAFWLSSNVRMKEWVGERTIDTMALRFLKYTIQDFQAAIALKRTWIEDDRIGAFSPALGQFAQQVSFWQAEQVWKAVVMGTEFICWDGQPFFHGSHPVNPDKPALGTLRNYQPNLPLTPDNYQSVRTEMAMYRAEDGRPLRARPTHLIVPPTLELEAKRILRAENWMEVRELPGGAYGFVPNTNLNKDSATLLIVPDIVTDTDSEQDWYLVDASKPVKPWGFGLRRAIELTTVDAPNSDSVFYRQEFVYGADARGGAFCTIPQLMYRATGASA